VGKMEGLGLSKSGKRDEFSFKMLALLTLGLINI